MYIVIEMKNKNNFNYLVIYAYIVYLFWMKILKNDLFDY